MDSAPGKGSAITIDRRQGADDASHAQPTSAVPRPDDRPATILLVDDEASIRHLARRVLESRGHRVIEAEDGGAALDAIAGVEDVDLVLTDVTMPRMGGVEMAARLADVRPDTPVIFMSGHGESALASDGVLDPSTRLLSKPFAIDDLAEMVRRTLAERA